MSLQINIFKILLESQNIEQILQFISNESFDENFSDKRFISTIRNNPKILSDTKFLDLLKQYVDMEIVKSQEQEQDKIRKIFEQSFIHYDYSISSYSSSNEISTEVKDEYYAFYPHQHSSNFLIETYLMAENRNINIEFNIRVNSNLTSTFMSNSNESKTVGYSFIITPITEEYELPSPIRKIQMEQLFAKICISLGFDYINVSDPEQISIVDNTIIINTKPIYEMLCNSFNNKFEISQTKEIIDKNTLNYTTTGDYIGICYTDINGILLVPKTFKMFYENYLNMFNKIQCSWNISNHDEITFLNRYFSKSEFIDINNNGEQVEVTIHNLNKNDSVINSKINVSLSFDSNAKKSEIELFERDFTEYMKVIIGSDPLITFVDSNSKSRNRIMNLRIRHDPSYRIETNQSQSIENDIGKYETAISYAFRSMILNSKLITLIKSKGNNSETTEVFKGSSSAYPNNLIIYFNHVAYNEYITDNITLNSYINSTNQLKSFLLDIYLK